MVLQRRRAADREQLASVPPPEADSLASKHADLWEFLTCTEWPDGSKRSPGSVTIFLDSGRLKACLSDKDAGLVAFVTASGLLDTLRALNKAVNDAGTDWRPAGDRGRAGKGK